MFLSWIISAVFSFWFLATIASHFPSIAKVKAVADSDRFLLLPRWNFFAPNPGTTDFHIFARGLSREGIWSEWREVFALAERPWTAMFWNPKKRYRKTILDLAQVAGQIIVAHGENETALILSPAYISLLKVITVQAKVKNEMQCQFALIRTNGHEEERDGHLVFRSYAHPC